ncbi:MAG TPA: VWA domain-containing protein [Chryseosolibacter sp.]
MKRIIFESAPEFIILCVIAGLAYASIQYLRMKQPWSKTMNWVLFGIRAVVATFIAFLLLGPIVKQINNLFEKPVFIIVQDNSGSVREATDTTRLASLEESLKQTASRLTEQGYETSIQNLAGQDVKDFSFSASSSDLNNALKRISNRYEGKNVAGVLLVSDGLFNSGLSPLYSTYNFPVHTLGVGDTTVRSDISIRNIAYNKIAYQGNKFPLRAEVQVKNLPSQPITVSLYKRGRLLNKQTKNSTGDQMMTFDFQPVADEQGIQKYDIEVEVNPNEFNRRNNRGSVFVEVVEGKKKILVVAAAPHPDIKALREVVEQNSNYEFLLHIPGVTEQQASALRPEDIDLAIFHQAPDLRGKTTPLFQTFARSKTSLFFILGQQSDIPLMARQNMPLKFENAPRDFDEVTPVTNSAFSNFAISPETNSLVASYPPVSVHYGKVQIPASATPLLLQKVGSVPTEKPLLSVDVQDTKKIAFMLGEGLWRWRLNEFDRTENTIAFDEVFGKLVQFLTTTDDKRKFRSYPVQQEFSNTEPIVFESQVYNDIFEPVYGNTIEIEVTEQSGKKTEYTYVTSPGNSRYQIGGLNEGVYRYKSRTQLNGKMEEVRGEFAVVERQAELQNLTADFDLLRKLSSGTGGKFFKASDIQDLQGYLQRTEAKSLIHTEETYDSIINLKWVFFLLLLLMTAEWGLRKYHGSY